MNSPATPPPLPPRDPPPPSSGQWSHAADTQGEAPSAKPWLWIAIGGGCFVAFIAIGLLATILVPKIAHAVGSARRAKARNDMHSLREALVAYFMTHANRFPDSLDVLVQPDQHGHTLLRDARVLPRDPWGHAYVYTGPSEGDPATSLCSYGSDGQPGGEGEAADIYEHPAEDR